MAQIAVNARPDPLASMDSKLEALSKLEAYAEDVQKQRALHRSNRFVRQALKAWRRGEPPTAAKFALRATEIDPTNPKAYHILASALRRMGFLHKALVTFEKAYQLEPGNTDILIDLGMCASDMKMHDVAMQFYRHHIAQCPNSPLGYNNLGSLQAELDDVPAAIETLRGAIYRMPHESILWHSLGVLLADNGRAEESIVFYNEAIRLEPKSPHYQHNIGYAYLHLGQLPKALEHYERALEGLKDPIDVAEASYSRAICQIGMGRFAEGFEGYESRKNPVFRAYVAHAISAPQWDGEPLEGKRLLVVGEQGIGDEIMFANTLPDLQRAVGPDGKLLIAVDSRLMPLFRRSFPEAEVESIQDRTVISEDAKKALRMTSFDFEKISGPDFYTLMGSTPRFLRKTLSDFPHEAFLKPDPERVAEFKKILAAGGNEPTVGICWRSMMLKYKREKYYSTLDMWEPILKTPGVRFINLQYDDCTAEIEAAAKKFGCKIEVIDGLDLKYDLDGAAALSACVDLVLSAPTAAAAIAGSVGTEVWFMSSCVSWPQLGTQEYPWYRKTRGFVPERFGDWSSLLPDVAGELGKWAAEKS